MRFAERFLVILALISLLMRFSGLKDGATMELIALPLLALFYLVATPFMLAGAGAGHAVRNRIEWTVIVAGILAGAGIAYCLISLMLYTLNWLPRLDMIENSGLILIVLLIIFGIRYRRKKLREDGQFTLRLSVLLGSIILAFFLPFPKIAAIPL
jgi:hypothetical protein